MCCLIGVAHVGVAVGVIDGGGDVKLLGGGVLWLGRRQERDR